MRIRGGRSHGKMLRQQAQTIIGFTPTDVLEKLIEAFESGTFVWVRKHRNRWLAMLWREPIGTYTIREGCEAVGYEMGIQVKKEAGGVDYETMGYCARVVTDDAFSLWLQGFPTAWHSCGVRAMRSSRRSARPS